MKKRFIPVLLVAAVTAGLLIGCGGKEPAGGDGENTETSGEQGEQGDKERVFTAAISYMPDSLRPSTASDDYTSMVRPLYEPLCVELRDGYAYYLADRVDISEDGLTYRIHLNEKANWSDGEPVTVKDILFTMDYGGLSSGGRSAFNTVNGQPVQFTEVDEKTLEIVLPEPYATYTTSFSRMLLMPAHAFDYDPTKVNDSGYFNSTDMVTSGPYTVAEINEDSLVYAARDDYYRGRPSVDKVIMRTIGSGSRQVAFENGELSYIRLTTAEELEKYRAESDKYKISSISEARLNYLQINPYGPGELSDDARKAIFLALDGQEIVDVAYGSSELATPANSCLTPDQSLYNPDCPGYKQDLETARELAKASGLEGRTLTYIYNADRPNMEAVATIIQQQLAEIGVQLSVEGLDSTSFFNRFFAVMFKSGQEGTWDLGSNGWDSERGQNGAQAFSYLADRNDAWGQGQEVRDMAERANAIADKEEAKAAWYELQERALEEYRVYPLTYTSYVMASQPNISGLDAVEIVPEFIDYTQIKIE